jgi:hypothetical protein
VNIKKKIQLLVLLVKKIALLFYATFSGNTLFNSASENDSSDWVLDSSNWAQIFGKEYILK